MKFISPLIFCFCLVACVQPTYRKTVIYTLKLSGSEHPESVGIRGGDKPLSWQSDTLLNAVIPDSLYTISITYVTGYKFTEAKFTLDGEFEFNDGPNRKIEFAEGDTTYVNAVFNQP